MSLSFAAEARARLDSHLDAVERVLVTAGHAREQRRAVMDDLEAQILEMLAARSATPALADVEAVLAQLDPPDAYSNAERARPPAIPEAQRRPSKAGRRALFCILGGVALLLIAALAIALFSAPVRDASPLFVTDYEYFKVTLQNGDLATVELTNNGDMTQLLGTYRDGRPQKMRTEVPSSWIAADGFALLQKIAAGGHATIQIRPARAYSHITFTILVLLAITASLLIFVGVILGVVAAVRNQPAAAPLRKPRYSRMAIAGLVCILLSFVTTTCAIPFGLFFLHSTMHETQLVAVATPPRVEFRAPTTGESAPVAVGHSAAEAPYTMGRRASNDERWAKLAVVVVPLFPFGLMGTLFGWIAFFQIRGSRGTITGTGMALFDGLFYPIIIFLLIPILLIFAA